MGTTAKKDVMTVHLNRELPWNRVRQRLAEWRRRMRSRNELSHLSDHCLKDIGVSRETADFEVSKPFWML